MMVILLGAELFTGDCLLAIGLPEREITPLQFVRMLAMVFFGNLLGGVLLSVLVSMSGQLDYSGGMLGAYTIKVALGKAMLTPAKAVTSGILCNILVCAAVLMALCAHEKSHYLGTKNPTKVHIIGFFKNKSCFRLFLLSLKRLLFSNK